MFKTYAKQQIVFVKQSVTSAKEPPTSSQQPFTSVKQPVTDDKPMTSAKQMSNFQMTVNSHLGIKAEDGQVFPGGVALPNEKVCVST